MHKTVIAVSGLAILLAAGYALAAAHSPKEHIEKLFEADADKDGVLTREEFVAGLSGHFDQLDADHDGRVSRADIEAMHAQGH